MESGLASLRREARATDERRLLVITGSPGETRGLLPEVLDAADMTPGATTVVGPEPTGVGDHLRPEASAKLLGQTREGVVVDLHAACRPNVLGRAVGAVDGGGLLVVLAPPLDDWPDRRDEFDETLAVPPFGVNDVAGNFRRRLVETLRAHPGIAILDAETQAFLRDGLTHPAPRRAAGTAQRQPAREGDQRYPAAAYEACLTGDQTDAVASLEALADDGAAVVVEADRGRGKSSACGLAAAGLALAGRDVLVTAPQYRNAAEVFTRARDLLETCDSPVEQAGGAEPRDLRTGTGRVRFERAVDATALPGDPDVVVVDEAAALPVGVLESFLAAPSVAFATTIHGYEGAGRGFSVRFRSRLSESDLAASEVTLTEPIRYAGGDPVEVWGFRALLLDARPPVEQLVTDARPETVSYERLDVDALVADEHRLREVFGLLVLAHYRTEPDDLARLLDAPNVSIRALVQDGHVVSVALLAREGDLAATTREHMYDGGRIAGNMLPDVLTTQLRDERAGVPVGMRVLRIATHGAVRSRGLGSRLLAEIREEFTDEVDWLGVGYGATPGLVSFWAASGYRPVHLSTTRNEKSGERSLVVLDPTSEAGRELYDRHARQFLARLGPMLSDPLDDLDPDVVRATLAAADGPVDPSLADWEWRQVASAAFGPGMFDMAPGPYRRLALAALVERPAGDDGRLTARQERLLVRKVLQGHDWDEAADALGYHSTAECMRALGDAFEPLVDAYGTETARTEADRYR
jgi:tRNA(Met) cytidine acetyltransferase